MLTVAITLGAVIGVAFLAVLLVITFVAWLAMKSTSMVAGMPPRRPLLSPRRRDLLRSGMPFDLVMKGLDSSPCRLEIDARGESLRG